MLTRWGARTVLPTLLHVGEIGFNRIKAVHDELVGYLGDLLYGNRSIRVHPASIDGDNSPHDKRQMEL